MCTGCARRPVDTPSLSCSRTTVRKRGRPASPSATPSRATARGASPAREHPRAAHRADALQGRAAVRHLHLLWVRDLPLGLALHTVTLIRGHRGLASLRHCVPPVRGRGGGGAAAAGVRGDFPGYPPGTVTT